MYRVRYSCAVMIACAGDGRVVCRVAHHAVQRRPDGAKSHVVRRNKADIVCCNFLCCPRPYVVVLFAGDRILKEASTVQEVAYWTSWRWEYQ